MHRIHHALIAASLSLALLGCPADPETVPDIELETVTLDGTVVPSRGPENGSTRIRVSGSGIHALARLLVGGRQAADVQVGADGDWIQGLTPAGAGVADVTVVSPGQPAQTLTGAFTYDPGPTITGITPDFGPQQGGTEVVVEGTSFDDRAQVVLGNQPVLELTVQSETRLRFVSPGGRGAVDLRVHNPDGQIALVYDAFSYLPPPRVLSVDPPTGSTEGDTLVTVTGTGFLEGATVTLDGVGVDDLSVDPPTRITFRTRPGAGSVALRVTNPDEQEAVVEDAFLYLSTPVVTGIDPTHGPETGDIPVIVTVEGLIADVTRAYVGGKVLRDAVIDVDAGTVSGLLPAGRGDVAVHATNLDVEGPELEGGFVYDPPPSIDALDPSSGPAVGGTELTVHGAGFVDGARIIFGGTQLDGTEFVDLETLRCQTPPGDPGPADVRVVNPDGQSDTLVGGFLRIAAPTLDSVSPSTGCISGGTEVAIEGAAFHEEATVFFGLEEAEVLARDGDAAITALAPAGEGTVTVRVLNPDGQQATVDDAFTYSGASVPRSVSPRHGPLEGGLELTVEVECLQDDVEAAFGDLDLEIVDRGEGWLRLAVPAVEAEAQVDLVLNVPGAGEGGLEGAFTYHEGVFDELVRTGTEDCSDGLVGDLDGDGYDDLLLADQAALLLSGDSAGGLGDGVEAFDLAGRRVFRLTPFDDTLDGSPPSLAIALEGSEQVQGGLALLRPAGRGWQDVSEETLLVPGTVLAVAAGDLTGDGLPDLVAGGIGGADLFIHQGDEGLRRVDEWVGGRGEGLCLAVVLGQLDGEGGADVFLAMRGSSNRLFSGTGQGGFVETTQTRLPLDVTETQAAAALDVDLDGDLDLVLGELGQDRLWRNDDGVFVDATDEQLDSDELETLDFLVVDYDGDGDDDLIAAKGIGTPYQVLESDGAGHLVDVTATVLPVQGDGPGSVALSLVGPGGVPDLVLAGPSSWLRVRDRIGPEPQE